MVSRTNTWDKSATLLKIVGSLFGIEYQSRIKEAEKHDRCGVKHHVNRLTGRQRAGKILEPAHRVASAEPTGDRRREQDDRRGEDRRNHARRVELQRQVRAIAAEHLVADLALRVIDQYFALTAFDEHDETVAYSLSIPFVSTFVFAAVMKHQEAPGTTFKKHMAIAKGLLSEDDYLLQEILFNPRTPGQVTNIRTELKNLLEIIENKDAEGMKKYLTKIREKIK